MADTYWKALDKVRATEDWKARTLAALERAPARPRMRVLAAAAACAALFATALAVSPGLREVLGTALGSFAPYAQEVEGVSAADQGIEVRVVSALSDGNRSVAYLEVRDLTGDRIGPDTFLSLAIGGLSRQPADYSASRYGGGRPLHYDAETGTILTSVELTVDGPPASSGTLDVVFERLTPSLRRESGAFSPSLLTGAALETVTLETGETVLVPEQTPSLLEGTELAALSSIGFGGDGRLHIQLRYGESLNVQASDLHASIYSRSHAQMVESGVFDQEAYDRSAQYFQENTETIFEWEGAWYLDKCFQSAPSDLRDIQVGEVSVMAIEGELVEGRWALSIPLENVPHRSFQAEEAIGAVTLRFLDLTTLGLSTRSDPGDRLGVLHYPVTVYLEDGSRIAAGYPDSSVINGVAYDHWSFPEPIDPEAVVGLAFDQWYVPIDGEAAGPGYWLTELPQVPGTESP